MQINLQNLKKTRSSHWGCSIGKVFLKFSQIHRRTPALKSLFNKLVTLLERESNFVRKRIQLDNPNSCEIRKIFAKTPSLRTPGDCFWKTLYLILFLIGYLIRQIFIHKSCIIFDPVHVFFIKKFL